MATQAGGKHSYSISLPQTASTLSVGLGGSQTWKVKFRLAGENIGEISFLGKWDSGKIWFEYLFSVDLVLRDSKNRAPNDSSFLPDRGCTFIWLAPP